MKRDLSTYIAKATGVSINVNVLEWWGKHSNELESWANVAKDLVLLQPTSAAAERVFSILKSSFSPQQSHSLGDYVQCSLILQ